MKGIILKSHEAQSLAAGKSVVIWRALKVQPPPGSIEPFFEDGKACFMSLNGDGSETIPPLVLSIPFPVGVPLFGKETWGIGTRPCPERGYWHGAEYKADLPLIDSREDLPMYALAMYPGDDLGKYCGGWKSSTSMPEWASRITLTLSDVKVRRPCDVTELEAFNMGFETTPCLICDESGTDPSGEVCADCAGDGWHSSYSNFHAQFEKTSQTCRESWVLYHFTALATPQTKP